METVIYIILGMQVLLGAYITWKLRVINDLEAHMILQKLILVSMNNALVTMMIEGEGNDDLVQAPPKVH